VDWVSGAAMFIRGELIDKIGGLDPDYFMYCEDTDFCFRAHTANFDVVYFPQAVITHAIGRSTDRAANKMIVRFHKSMLLFYRKNTLAKTWAPIKWVLLVLAAGALAVRASLFLSKNFWDAFMRRVRRR
ncbi:MAG: glycosyltransferase family 2 protein, partial [Chthonomonadaceae bacterium]|nr:glycosyltransferase family 2 protein [Chthonomonadaceae bacterium]